MSSTALRCAASILAILCAVATLIGADPPDAEEQQNLARLHAALRQASQDQDQDRLRAIYSDLAELQPESAEAHRGLGLACYLQGDFDPAIAALETAARLQPDLAGARLYLGICYYRTNRFAEALTQLEGSPELRADDPVAQYWLGAAYRATGRLSEAIPALEGALAHSPSNSDVLELLTRAYSEHASEWFRRLLSSGGNSAPARLLRAEELALDGVHEAALREAAAASDTASFLSGPHRLKGEVHWARGEQELAVAEFRAELRNNPCSTEAHLRIGVFALNNGDARGAIPHLQSAWQYVKDDGVRELLDQAYRMDGGSPPQETGTGQASVPSGDPLGAARSAFLKGEGEQASRLLESLISEQPEAMEERWLLATCRLEMGDAARAVEQLRKILSRKPEDPSALYALGRSYERLAEQSADRLFELSPRSTAVRLLRGESFEKGPRYDFEKALAEFRHAEALSPGDPSVHHAIGRLLFKMKRFDDAVPHLEAVLATNRSHGMANYLLGKIRLLEGDRGRAIESLQAAVKARPELIDARKDLARALVLEGQLDEGISIYEALLERHPSDRTLHALLATAYRRAGRMEEAREQAAKARLTGSSNPNGGPPPR